MSGKHVIEVTTQNFERDVIQKSMKVPVLVDFWASWCTPCLTLGPTLEKVVSEFNGRIVLAKVDVDSNPDLAEAFAVQSIPAVKLFAAGNVVSEFTGVVPESQIRTLLQQVLPSGPDSVVQEAKELRDQGELARADSLVQQVLQEDPTHEAALEIAAAAAMAGGRVDEALDLIKRIETPSKDMHFLSEGQEFWRRCAEMSDEEKMSDAPPEGLAGKIAFAACLASKGELVRAMDLLLEILETDKAFQEGLPRKAIVSIFVVMGRNNPIVKQYQSKLARLVF